MKNFVNQVGELRVFLFFVTLGSLSAIPFTNSDGVVRMDGLGLFPDVLVPVVSFLLVFILLLDMLMSRVFMIEADDEKCKKFKSILLLEFILVVSLISFWTPYFFAVLS